MSLPAAKAQHFSEVKTKGLLAWKPWTSSESSRQLRHSGGIGFKLLLLCWWENITMGFPPKKTYAFLANMNRHIAPTPPSKASNVFPTSGLPIWLKLTGVFIQGDSPIKKHMGQFEAYYCSHSHWGKPPKPSNGSWVADTTQHGTGIQEFSHCNEKILGDKLRDVFIFVRKSSSLAAVNKSTGWVILLLKKQQYPVVCLCNNFFCMEVFLV